MYKVSRFFGRAASQGMYNIWFHAGVGYMFFNPAGDIKNNLLSLSGSAGTKFFITDNFGLDLSLKYRYMLLYDVKLADRISAAYGVSLSALSAHVGILYKL